MTDRTLIRIHLEIYQENIYWVYAFGDMPTEINKFSVEFLKLREMSFYGYGWASYSILVG